MFGKKYMQLNYVTELWSPSVYCDLPSKAYSQQDFVCTFVKPFYQLSGGFFYTSVVLLDFLGFSLLSLLAFVCLFAWLFLFF